jgi:hypothetical protein
MIGSKIPCQIPDGPSQTHKAIARNGQSAPMPKDYSKVSQHLSGFFMSEAYRGPLGPSADRVDRP